MVLVLLASGQTGPAGISAAAESEPPSVTFAVEQVGTTAVPADASTALASTAAASTAGSEEGRQLIRDAAVRVHQAPSIAAKLRLSVHLYDQQLVGTGTYLQMGQGEDQLLRLELRVQADDHTVTFQQIGDGRFLWLRRELPGSVDLGRIDLKRLQLGSSDGGAPQPPANTSVWMALGGLSKLISSLEDNLRFAAPQPAKLTGVDMLALTGTWKTESLARFVPGLGTESVPAEVDLASLPPHLPHRVVVFLGRDDLFPYRVEYQRLTSHPGKNICGQVRREAWGMITRLDLYEVQVPAAIDPLQFVYRPDATEIEDRTKAFLDSWRQTGK